MAKLSPELEFALDEMFLIPNLAFLKYVGAKPSPTLVRAHNTVADKYSLTRINPDTLEYEARPLPEFPK